VLAFFGLGSIFVTLGAFSAYAAFQLALLPNEVREAPEV
jgi:hypothetical protein